MDHQGVPQGWARTGDANKATNKLSKMTRLGEMFPWSAPSVMGRSVRPSHQGALMTSRTDMVFPQQHSHRSAFGRPSGPRCSGTDATFVVTPPVTRPGGHPKATWLRGNAWSRPSWTIATWPSTLSASARTARARALPWTIRRSAVPFGANFPSRMRPFVSQELARVRTRSASCCSWRELVVSRVPGRPLETARPLKRARLQRIRFR